MKVSLGPEVWSEPRFEALRRALGWTQAETLGMLTLFWHGTRDAGLIDADRPSLRGYLSVEPDSTDAVLEAMQQTGYLVPAKGGTLVVEGNERPVVLQRARRDWGKMGGPLGNKKAPTAKLPKPVAKETKIAKPTLDKAAQEAAKTANRACWDAYCGSYKDRYGVEPLRDAKVNSMIAQFVKRIGQERAPAVIRFYVAHDERDYLRANHALNCALRDAEALHTQWMRGQATTSQDVRAVEQSSRIRSQIQRVQEGTL